MNKKKIIYIILGIVAVVFLLYHSVYLMSLSERTEQLKARTFDPEKAVDLFWQEAPEKLPKEAVDLIVLDEQLRKNPQETAQKYGKTLGIGAPYSVLVKGTAEIESVQDELVKLRLNSDIDYSIRTGSIFSNTIREASGYFDLDEFETTMDFNLVAIEINNRIVREIIVPIGMQLIPGARVEFVGASDINLRRLPVTSVEIIPIRLKIVYP